MLRQNRLLIFIGFSVLLSIQGHNKVLADVETQLDQAQELVEQYQYEQAEMIYRQLVIDYPATENGLLAQEGLTTLYIEADRLADANVAFEQMVTGFTGHPRLAKAVDHVADAYRENRKYAEALDIYQYAVDAEPDAEHAIDSQMGIARIYILMEDYEAAQAATDKLFTDYAEHENIAKVIHLLAYEYHHKAKNDHKALELYQQVVSNWPEAKDAIRAQMGIAKIYIERRDDPNAQAAIDKLITDYGQRDGIAKAVDNVADKYRGIRRYQSALGLYQLVIDKWPDSKHAIQSQASVARCYIVLGDDSKAADAIDKLITDYAQSDGIAKAVDNVADKYRGIKRYQSALGLYQLVIDRWPDSKHAIQSQASIARCYIALGDDTNAADAIDILITDFAGNSDLSEVLSDIADEYDQWGRYVEAKQLYKEVVENSAVDYSDERQLETGKVLVLYHINDGNDLAATRSIEQLITDFNSQPELANAVFQIARQYYEKGRLYFEDSMANESGHERPGVLTANEYFRKTLVVSEKIIDELPGFDEDATVEAYNLAAECHRRLNEYAEAACYYQQVVDRNPHFKYASHAQFMIGYCYDHLADLGQISNEEAELVIRSAYQKVLENYPDSPPVRAVNIWLDHNKGNLSEELNEEVRVCGCD